MIYFELPNVPLSINSAYVKGRGGVRFLSAKGKTYKMEVKTHIVRHFPQELQKLKPNVPYCVYYRLTFGDATLLLNKGYPESTENRYKKFDVSNRVKLLEDALSEATAIDDCHNWVVCVSKHTGDADKTQVWVWSPEDGNNPFATFLDPAVLTPKV